MSKNSVRRRQATEKSMQDMPAYEPSHYEKKQMEMDRRKDNARPSLIKRIGVGLLDFVFAAIFAGALFAGAYFGIFPKLGYNEAANTIVEAYDTSHLYHNVNGNYTLISEDYDSDKTPEENYDGAITTFYKEKSQAKLEEYENAKISSGYYVKDGDSFVRTEGTTDSIAKTFLEQQYDKAVDYLFEDQSIIDAYHKTFNIMVYSILITVSISTLSLYLIVPLVDKKHRTLGYMIGKIMPVDSKDMKPAFWDRILLRNLIFIVFTFISPITLYIWAKAITYSFIPFFANTFVLIITHSNSGIHDYAGHCNVVNESFSNPFENLKAITGQGDDNNEHFTNQ